MAILDARRAGLSAGVKAARAAVLLSTGAMNPVHVGHAELLRSAARRLEQEGYAVLGAFLSPTHDDYVQPKARSFGKVALSGDMRLELVRRTLGEEEPLVSAGGWEVSHSRFADFPEVCGELQRHLAASHVDARVFYACGTDHAKKCGLSGGMRHDVGLVIVPREGERPPREVPEKVLVAEPAAGEVAGYSSTKVRRAVANKDEEYLNKALAPSAAAFLLKPSAEEEERFAADFRNLRGGRV